MLFFPCNNVFFYLLTRSSCPLCGGPIVDLGCKSISNILAINSAENIRNIALLFVETMPSTAFFSHLRTSTLKIVPGPTMVEPLIDAGY